MSSTCFFKVLRRKTNTSKNKIQCLLWLFSNIQLYFRSKKQSTFKRTKLDNTSTPSTPLSFLLGSISSMFYEQLLSVQILKVQKKTVKLSCLFCAFGIWTLMKLNLDQRWRKYFNRIGRYRAPEDVMLERLIIRRIKFSVP